ncbi:hypothetical protein SNEBB_004698 [Seison nebaliae]|nr:hypothetical protein SNEBB_004698 [Seison nebaliae]
MTDWRIGIKITPPYVMRIKNSTKFYGLAIDLLTKICNMLNVTYELEQHNFLGSYIIKEKRYFGIAKHLHDNDIDVAAVPWSILIERFAALKFTTPIFSDSFGIMTLRRNGSNQYDVLKVLKPFSFKLWIVSLIITTTITIILYCLLSYENRFIISRLKLESRIFRNNTEGKLRRAFMFTFGKFFKQNVELEPNASSTRFVVGSWSFVTFITTACYTASLTANLTINKPVRQINSLDDIILMDYTVSMTQTARNILKMSNQSIYQKILKQWKFKKYKTFNTVARAASFVKRVPNHAVIMDYSQLLYLSYLDCDLYLAKERFQYVSIAFATSYQFKQLDQLNKLILQLNENGYTRHLVNVYWQPSVCGGIQSVDLHTTTMEQNAPPYTSYEGDDVFGFAIDIMNNICNTLKISCEIKKYNEFGHHYLKNHSYTEIIDGLRNDLVDFTVGPWSITNERLSAINFTVPLLAESLGILTLRRNDTDVKGYFKIFRPFHYHLWITCLVATIIITIFTYLLLVYENRYVVPKLNDNHQHIIDNSEGKFRRSVAFAFGKFLKQNVALEPNSFPTRIIVGMWWFISLVIMSCYTANLTANLAIKSSPISINTLSDILKFGYSIGIYPGSFFQKFFQKELGDTSEIFQKSIIERNKLVYLGSQEEVVDKLRTIPDFAVILDYSQLEYIAVENCDLYLGEQRFLPTSTAFAVSSSFPYLKEVNEMLNSVINNIKIKLNEVY